MGVLEDTFNAAHSNPEAGFPVTLVTNQPGGEVSYASGLFTFSPGRIASPTLPIFLPDRLVGPSDGLAYLFSDRQSLLQEPPSPGLSFGHSNPFSVDRADRLGVTISHNLLGSGFVANFTLLSWGNLHFQVPLTDQSDGVATGMGAGVGASSSGAYYVFSFGNPIEPPR